MNTSDIDKVRATLKNLINDESTNKSLTSTEIMILLQEKLPYDIEANWGIVEDQLNELVRENVVFKDQYSNLYYWDKKALESWYKAIK